MSIRSYYMHKSSYHTKQSTFPPAKINHKPYSMVVAEDRYLLSQYLLKAKQPQNLTRE